MCLGAWARRLYRAFVETRRRPSARHSPVHIRVVLAGSGNGRNNGIGSGSGGSST